MPKVELYTCGNQACEFNKESRRWSVYADLPAKQIFDVVSADGTVSKELREDPKPPSAKNRSRCPGCGDFGTKVAADELRNIPTGEDGYA